MTTVLEIRTAVGAMTGDTQFVLFFPADILRYLNWGTLELCRDLKITQSVLTGSPGTLSNFDVVGGIIMPPTFTTENAVYMGTGASMMRLTRIPQNIFWQDGITPTASQPTAYTVSDYLASPNTASRHLIPFPAQTPGSSMYYRVEYQGVPAVLVNDTDVLQTPAIMDELLVMYVTMRCKMQEDDFQSAASFKQEIRERKQALLADFAEHSEFEFFTIQDNSVPVTAIWE
jgi:hypothetical protein